MSRGAATLSTLKIFPSASTISYPQFSGGFDELRTLAPDFRQRTKPLKNLAACSKKLISMRVDEDLLKLTTELARQRGLYYQAVHQALDSVRTAPRDPRGCR